MQHNSRNLTKPVSKTKRKSLSGTMLFRLTVATVATNFLLLCIIGTYAKVKFREEKGIYLQEISSNISSTITYAMEEYVSISKVLAESQGIIQLMEESSKASPMHQNPEASGIVGELSRIAPQHSQEIVFLALLDVEQDGYLMHTGDYSDDSFSFATRPYFSAVTQRRTIITEPYVDVVLGAVVVTVCSPVYASQGEVVGAILLDISTDFISQLIQESSFGVTGDSIVLDAQSSIIAHEDGSHIGENISVMAYQGSEIEKELTQPSGNLTEFVHESQDMIATVGTVGDFGWKLITSMTYREFDQNSIDILRMLLAMMLLSAVVVLWLAYFTVKKALDPIGQLKSAMHQLAVGNTHYEFEYESENEIGELAEDLRETSRHLAGYIDEIHRMLSCCSKGDFTVSTDMEFVGDFKHIQESIEEFTTLISAALQGMKETVSQVSIGSEYVASGAQNLAEGSSRQSASVKELNDHVSDIAEKVRKNVENINFVHDSSREMERGLKTGGEHMSKLVLSMDEMISTSDGIQKIVKTIEDVAFQTNILALNAAVEAARAGTAGKGFAVVAEEVRNLSTRTSVAVQETTALIDETVRAVSSSGQIMQSTASELEKVNLTLDSFMESLENITVASKDQAIAIEEIHQGVESITSVMQQNSAISEESAATSQELSSQAAVMLDTMEQFKTQANT